MPIVPAVLAKDEASAVDAARAVGGPVVLKIASADILHKSDIGGVALNLIGDDAVAEAFRRVMAAVNPLVGGGGRLVTGASLDSVMPGEVRLELSFARELDFVLAPTASGLGLRLRLLGLNKRKGGALLSDVEAPTDYAVNLESSTSPIERAAVEAAAAELQTQAYVSETDIEEEHWYRLRVGPFATRAEAERVLSAAVQHHPQAWLADEDVQTALEPVDRAGGVIAQAARQFTHVNNKPAA